MCHGAFPPPIYGVTSVALDPVFCVLGNRPGEREGALKESGSYYKPTNQVFSTTFITIFVLFRYNTCFSSPFLDPCLLLWIFLPHVPELVSATKLVPRRSRIII